MNGHAMQGYKAAWHDGGKTLICESILVLTRAVYEQHKRTGLGQL